MLGFSKSREIVEAVRWDGTSALYHALYEALGDAVAMHGDGRLSVFGTDAARLADVGDWVVKEPSGHCFVMGNAAFQYEYGAGLAASASATRLRYVPQPSLKLVAQSLIAALRRGPSLPSVSESVG
jgi:hypothetical protein